MVNFKVTDGRTTRRFQMKAGEHSYEQLKDRLASLFPEAMEDNQQPHLHYTDSDGDQITISTDAEFQEVLQQLPTNATWKLHIRPQRKQQTTQSPSTGRSPNRFSLKAPSRRMRVARYNPLLSLSHPFPSVRSSFWDFPSWSVLDTEFDEALHRHAQLFEALSKEPQKDQDKKQESSGSEKQSNKEDEGGNSKVSRMTESSVPGLIVRNFGSWEPQKYEGPSGRRMVISPVGYYVSWSSGPTTEQEDNDKKEEDSTEEQVAGGEEEMAVGEGTSS